VDGQGNYSIANYTGHTVQGSFDAFTYRIDPHRVQLRMHGGKRLSVAIAGIQTDDWGISWRRRHQYLRYYSAKPFTFVQLCAYPRADGGFAAYWGNEMSGSATNYNATSDQASISGPGWARPWEFPDWLAALVGLTLGLINVVGINVAERREREQEEIGWIE
jgi:hypothetical protein